VRRLERQPSPTTNEPLTASLKTSCDALRTLPLLRGSSSNTTRLFRQLIWWKVPHTFDEKLIAEMWPLVLVSMDSGASGTLLFQDCISYRAAMNMSTASQSDRDACFLERSLDALTDIYQYPLALEVLMRCSLRRRGEEVTLSENGTASYLDFKKRRIPASSSRVSRLDLYDGHTYFYVNFFDNDRLIPALWAFVFIGMDVQDDEETKREFLRFQDLHSFLKGVRYDSGTEANRLGPSHDSSAQRLPEFHAALRSSYRRGFTSRASASRQDLSSKTSEHASFFSHRATIARLSEFDDALGDLILCALRRAEAGMDKEGVAVAP
jgi:hypothetical protein